MFLHGVLLVRVQHPLGEPSNLTDASSFKGHEMTATIAQMYLHPSVQPRICSIVYPNGDPNDSRCHLGVLATWADRIRGIPQYRWAGAYHYVGGIGDWPPSKCQFGEQGWHGRDGVNVLGGIYNTTNWLREGKSGAGEATKFLIHFVGDLHQPLHLTDRDRGGNGGKRVCFILGRSLLIPLKDKVRFHNRITSKYSDYIPVAPV
jgi:S1/P1 Nuclease